MSRWLTLLISGLILTVIVMTNKAEVNKLATAMVQRYQPQSQSALLQLPIIREVIKPTFTAQKTSSISLDQLRAKVNLARQLLKIPALSPNSKLCSEFERVATDSAINNTKLRNLCRSCQPMIYASFIGDGDEESIIEDIHDDATASGILKNKSLTNLCLVKNNDTVHFLGFKPGITASPLPAVKKVVVSAINIFSEMQLWQALVDYRHAHKLPDLVREEQICTYARKRVQDQIDLLKSNKPASEYPVPGKYPLDGHDGFKKDAESEKSFSMAGKNELAENLAYWPNAASPTQVIEWGWDTSTEGHKETQLTTYYTHACLASKDGFYVAIFGK